MDIFFLDNSLLCFVLGDGKASQSYNEGKGKEILSFEQILFYVVAYHVFFKQKAVITVVSLLMVMVHKSCLFGEFYV